MDVTGAPAPRETGGIAAGLGGADHAVDAAHRQRSRLYLTALWRQLVRRQRFWRAVRYLIFLLALLVIVSKPA